MAPDMEKSDIVLSQQGRDKGRLLMVLDTDAEYLLLADGRRRRVERPKPCVLCGQKPQRRGPAAASGRKIVKQ